MRVPACALFPNTMHRTIAPKLSRDDLRLAIEEVLQGLVAAVASGAITGRPLESPDRLAERIVCLAESAFGTRL